MLSSGEPTRPKPLHKQYEESSSTYLTNNVNDLFSLVGKVVAITGGAQGIGLALAFACAEAGAMVALIDAKKDPHPDYEILEKQCAKAQMYQSDVTDYDRLSNTFDDIFRDFGRLDGCITAAGICPDEPFLSRRPESVRRCFDINVLGTYFAAQLAAKQMVRSSPSSYETAGGSIVMIGSVAAHQASIGQYLSDYCSSKGAVVSLSKELSVELTDVGIRSNVISPGYMNTEMAAALFHSRPSVAKHFHLEPPMRRIGDRTDLKAAAVYLLSNASAYMTGGELLITGGLHAGRKI